MIENVILLSVLLSSVIFMPLIVTEDISSLGAGADEITCGQGWCKTGNSITDGIKTYLRHDNIYRPYSELNFSSGNWSYLMEEFETYYKITSDNTSFRLPKRNWIEYEFGITKIKETIHIPNKQALVSRSVKHNNTVRYIPFPFSASKVATVNKDIVELGRFKTGDFWIRDNGTLANRTFELPNGTNIIEEFLNYSYYDVKNHYKLKIINNEIRLYFDDLSWFQNANYPLVIDPSWTLNGSIGNSWTNVTHSNTTSVQSTGNVELQDAVPDFVSKWRFDEGTGTNANDENTINNNDGTLTNMNVSEDWVSGKYGYALEFDETDDYVDCGNNASLSITGAITFGLWMKSSSLVGNDAGFISKSSDNHKYFSTGIDKVYELAILDNTIYFQISDGTTTNYANGASSSIIDNNWHFIVAVWDGTTNVNGIKIYKDGTVWHQGTATISAIQTKVSNLDIGGYAGAYPYNGSIDQVRIYNRALSAEEINQTKDNEHSILGNLTSNSKDAESGYVWKTIRFDGKIPTGTNVSIYFNSSSDNGAGDPWSGYQLVQAGALNDTNYTIPASYQERYGSWRFKLETNNDSVTPEIYNVTIYSETSADSTDPLSNSPADASYVQNSAQTIGWVLTDETASGNYTVYRNGTIQNASTSWANNTNLNVWVNTTTIGDNWNYTIYFNDSAGNDGIPDTVLINITEIPDTTDPLSNSPADASYVQNSAQTIGWVLTDETASGNYTVYRNGTIQNASTSWANNTNLNVWVNTTTIGDNWNYTIYFNDSAGNDGIPDTVLINITEIPDTTDPLSNSPADASYVQNSAQTIGWVLTDETASGNYTVYRNGTIQNASTSWANNTNLNVWVNTTTIGDNWNYTIYFNDSAGNDGIPDTVLINITEIPDTTDPLSNSPADASYVQNSAQTIGWVLTDETASGNYTVYRNGTIQNASTSWANNTNLNVWVNTTTIGDNWNYTIYFNDSAGNDGIPDTVLINITEIPDTTDPLSNSPADASYVQNSAQTIGWVLTDETASGNYTVYRNGTIQNASTSWANNTNLNVWVNTTTIGDNWNYTIYFNDSAGNDGIPDTVLINITEIPDTTDPLSNSPADASYVQNSAQTIGWVLTDETASGNYTVYRNGTIQNASTSWANNTNLNVWVNTTTIGDNWNYTIYFNDSAGNDGIPDTVLINITEIPDTTDPLSNSPADASYVQNSAQTIGWVLTDETASGNYTVYRNGTIQNASTSWANNTNLNVWVNTTTIGDNWNYTIYFNDSAGNDGIPDTVLINITEIPDTTDPLSNSPADASYVQNSAQTIGWVLTDETASGNYTVYRNGTIQNASTSWANNTNLNVWVNTTTIGDNWNYTIYFNDSAGNDGIPDTVLINITEIPDTTDPLSNSPADASYVQNSAQTIGWVLTDETASGNYTVYRNGTIQNASTSWANNTNLNVWVNTTTIGDNWNYTIYFNDSAGNDGIPDTVLINITEIPDTTDPLSNSPADASYVQNSAQTIGWVLTDETASGNYTVYRNGTIQNASTSWANNTNLNVWVNTTTIGDNWNYTIYFNDSAGNDGIPDTVLINITEIPDTTDPLSNSPADASYVQNSAQTIGWVLTDETASGNYTVYRNGTIQNASTSWANNTNLNVWVNTTTIGDNWNYTIYFNDSAGNDGIPDTVLINITEIPDTTDPLSNSPADASYVQNSAQTIGWVLTDETASGNYTVYRNGTIQNASTSWANNTNLNVWVNTTTIGDNWNYTIYFNDSAGNDGIPDTVLINITEIPDTTDPLSNSPADASYVQNSAQTIGWVLTDETASGNYTVYRNGTIQNASTSWANNTNLNVWVNTTTIGDNWNYTIYFNDSAGNDGIPDTVLINITEIPDTTDPLSNSPADASYVQNSAQTIGWVLTDETASGNYTVYRNGTIQNASTSWANNTNLNVWVNTTTIGDNWNYTIYFNDSAGNDGIPDTVLINITEIPDTTDPLSNSPADASYVQNSAQTIGWVLTDETASGNYTVYRNGTIQNASTSWANNTNLNVWVNTTTIGDNWNYTIYFNDSAGNDGIPDTVLINITEIPDTTDPLSNSPADASYVQNSAQTIGWVLTDETASGNYTVYRNGTIQNASTSWANNTNLNVWVNTTTIGDNWNYTIYFNDSAGNDGIPDTVLINITEIPDTTDPLSNSPADASYVQNSAQTIGWVLTDETASGNYTVYRNGTIQNASTSWANNTNLNVWVNTTTIGDNWNYTIYFNDSAGNDGIPDTVLINIIEFVFSPIRRQILYPVREIVYL